MIRVDVDRYSLELTPEKVRVVDASRNNTCGVDVPGDVFSYLVAAYIGVRDEARYRKK